ncbi:uncharacterized protein LY89DRAFT_323577 [Mollisia scopiformis]|uniref:Uncharacterized protein n=1 Tax=Mollisia scopiformis TaxID=149040 RepID=A0A132B9L3_MOLSC|nr:uncharacterized protein LY89DRAFT_323577 [Mollisia scopiformis]KUJ08689.1 hypothetical protein LY89DRAFT_323577 [Mollisia scopiformis]
MKGTGTVYLSIELGHGTVTVVLWSFINSFLRCCCSCVVVVLVVPSKYHHHQNRLASFFPPSPRISTTSRRNCTHSSLLGLGKQFFPRHGVALGLVHFHDWIL